MACSFEACAEMLWAFLPSLTWTAPFLTESDTQPLVILSKTETDGPLLTCTLSLSFSPSKVSVTIGICHRLIMAAPDGTEIRSSLKIFTWGAKSSSSNPPYCTLSLSVYRFYIDSLMHWHDWSGTTYRPTYCMWSKMETVQYLVKIQKEILINKV